MGLAAVAMNYIGHPYFLGGAPGINGDKPWDCSSAVSWWAGHDMGMRLPGQAKAGYDGSSHGPGSWQYITWAGATTIQGPPAADDLVIWPGMGAMGHIGVAIDAANMISALNPVNGTKVTPIASTKPGIHIYRRLNGQAINANPGCAIPGLMIALARWEIINGKLSNG